MIPLPIDPLLPAIVAAVLRRRAAVVVASPGAGKTTRVPPALARALPGSVLVLEPRRIAARAAAVRVAEELGESVGETVGFQVRFEKRASAKTRVLYLTEALLTRRLIVDPELAGVGAVVIDEVHERSLHGDLALALLTRLRARRPALAVVAMSATVAAEPLAALLDAEVISCSTASFPVEVEHLDRPSREPLERQVAAAVRRLAREGLDGHALVFLPGAADIRKAASACEPLAREHGLALLPLHGELGSEAQDRALRPSDEHKLILATNVAETSITIDGVAAVVDGGLAKVARVSPWSGLPSLRTEPIARASALQRTGRAGRTRPGRCLRLYTRADFERRPEQGEPEIARAELSEAVLALALAGVTDLAALRWLEPPPAHALAAASSLLRRLGALDAAGAPTPRARALGRLPLSPRLGSALCAAEELGVVREVALACALLGERGDVRRREPDMSASLWDALDRFEAAERERFEPAALAELGLDRGTTHAVARARTQLAKLARAKAPAPSDVPRAVSQALLAGFPDRVAKRIGRETPNEARLALSSGGTAALRDDGAFGTYLLAVDASERSGRPPLVRLALPLCEDDLLAREELDERCELGWSAERERVEELRQLRYGALVLIESRAPASPGPEAAQLLLREAQRANRLTSNESIDRWLARARWLRARSPGWPPIDEAAALAQVCQHSTSLAELGEGSLRAALEGLLDGVERARLAREAPETLRLPSGRELDVRYAEGQPPAIASYLQDFFGMAEGPRLAGEPVLLELWAPSGRPLQLTRDLPSFWRQHYPELRRSLMRRYPKHHWPEDPAAAAPARLKRQLS